MQLVPRAGSPRRGRPCRRTARTRAATSAEDQHDQTPARVGRPIPGAASTSAHGFDRRPIGRHGLLPSRCGPSTGRRACWSQQPRSRRAHCSQRGPLRTPRSHSSRCATYSLERTLLRQRRVRRERVIHRSSTGRSPHRRSAARHRDGGAAACSAAQRWRSHEPAAVGVDRDYLAIDLLYWPA